MLVSVKKPLGRFRGNLLIEIVLVPCHPKCVGSMMQILVRFYALELYYWEDIYVYNCVIPRVVQTNYVILL